MERKYLENILSEILKEEKEKLGIDVCLKTYTRKEYYKSEEFKKGLKSAMPFNLLEFLAAPINNAAHYNRRADYAIVFIDEHLNKEATAKNIFDYIFCIYHELRHIEQYHFTDYEERNIKNNTATKTIKNFNLKDPNLFLYQMENFSDIRLIEYEGLWSEIDADSYASFKTKEFVTKNMATEDFEQIFQVFDILDEVRKIEYNFDEVFKYFNFKIKDMCINPKDTWLEIFYDRNLKFKPLDEIMENITYGKINTDIANMILTSEYFLKSVCKKNMSLDQNNMYTELKQKRIENIEGKKMRLEEIRDMIVNFKTKIIDII